MLVAALAFASQLTVKELPSAAGFAVDAPAAELETEAGSPKKRAWRDSGTSVRGVGCQPGPVSRGRPGPSR